MRYFVLLWLGLVVPAQADVTVACKCVFNSGLCGSAFDLSGALHEFKVTMSTAPSGTDKQHLLNLACWNLASDDDRQMCCPIDGDKLDKLVNGKIAD
jgi:hypothetical protein